jgi:hypothetical protein
MNCTKMMTFLLVRQTYHYLFPLRKFIFLTAIAPHNQYFMNLTVAKQQNGVEIVQFCTIRRIPLV